MKYELIERTLRRAFFVVQWLVETINSHREFCSIGGIKLLVDYFHTCRGIPTYTYTVKYTTNNYMALQFARKTCMERIREGQDILLEKENAVFVPSHIIQHASVFIAAHNMICSNMRRIKYRNSALDVAQRYMTTLGETGVGVRQQLPTTVPSSWQSARH
ncbi:hypothetical protein M426DRAFT_265591 [Hypoxylon sp. CI-4A]|nr:hypothetical protein M426DRAFT_265591 [Hypoxylon sp. CI-4A]